MGMFKGFEQQIEQVRDVEGRRWIKCEECGLISTVDDFVVYGGENRINLGICRSCMRKKK